MTPREHAIAKIAHMIDDYEHGNEYELAEEILDALGVEVASADTTPQEGDILTLWNNSDMYPSAHTYSKNSNQHYLDDYLFQEILRHKGKPTIYVENIKGEV